MSTNGVYRSGDGGNDWTQVLSLGPNRIARVATPRGAIAVAIYDSSPHRSLPDQRQARRHPAFPRFRGLLDLCSRCPRSIPAARRRPISPSPSTRPTPTSSMLPAIASRSCRSPSRPSASSDGTTAPLSPRRSPMRAPRTARPPMPTPAPWSSTPWGGWSRAATAVFTANQSRRLGRVARAQRPVAVAARPYAVAYDSISRRLVMSAQDTGSAYQDTPGNSTYAGVGGGGDGVKPRSTTRPCAGRAAA